MRTIVAGSRSIKDQQLVDYVLDKLIRVGYINITEVVSGTAGGVDTLGENWAKSRNIALKRFPAEWDNITAPGAIVKTNNYGKKYNVLAGYWRNEIMANNADALVAIWDGKSNGTNNMIETAVKKGLLVFIYNSETRTLSRK